MMFHPFDRDLLAHPALASLWLTFDFKGVPSHAAIAPARRAQRAHRVPRHVPPHRRAARPLPRRRARPRVRHRRRPGREHHPRARRVRVQRPRARRRRSSSACAAIVERCARGAAMASGVEVDDRRPPRATATWSTTWPSRAASALTSRRSAARRASATTRVGAGSTDMGDVSHVVPSIHPWLAIVDEGAALCHEHRVRRGRRDGRARRARRSSRRRRSRAPRSSSWRTPSCARAVSAGVGSPLERRVTSIRQPRGVVHRSSCTMRPGRRPPRAGARSSRPRARSPSRSPSRTRRVDLGPRPSASRAGCRAAGGSGPRSSRRSR